MCHPEDLIYEGWSFVIMKTLFMRAGVCHPEDLIYEGWSFVENEDLIYEDRSVSS